MGWRMTITLHTCLLLSCSSVLSQQVSYCEPYTDRFTLRQEMLGKVGDYFWVSSSNRKRIPRGSAFANNEERDFVIYDGKSGVKGILEEPLYTVNSVREYLVTSDEHFDRINLLQNGRETEVRLQRYEAGGEALEPDHNIGIFPFLEPGTSFMLVRSLDRKKSLLLGFEFLSSAAPRLHAFLYDQDWHLLSKRVYRHPFLTQPIIQDDYSTYPLEDFNKSPIKLGDDGQWLMLSPSRTNSNFLLFHFAAADTAVNCREIMLPGTSIMEDVCLSLDNSTGEAVGGILSTFHYSPLKNVQVVRYSTRTKSFSLDSSYRLNTLGGRRIRNDNLVKENFVAVPGRGFLLMKEYGRAYEQEVDAESFDEGWDPAFLFASNDIPDPTAGPSPARIRVPEPKYGYARYNAPANPVYHDRGDLSLYYFPGSRKDSSWSGMISQEQVTEFNSPNLSYMFLPMQDRIVFLYNSYIHGEKMYASTTVIDPRGEQVTNEGILFWGLKNTLDFQSSRQVAPDQIVIPYDIYVNGNANGKVGFAVVLFR
jgi:hypothetical protein